MSKEKHGLYYCNVNNCYYIYDHGDIVKTILPEDFEIIRNAEVVAVD